MPNKQFETLVAFYRAVQLKNNQEQDVDFHISDSTQLEWLKAFYADWLDDHKSLPDYGVFFDFEDQSLLQVGADIKLIVKTPRLGIGRFSPNIDHLLKGPTARIKEPKYYYLFDTDFCNLEQGQAPDLVGKYRLVLELVKLLEEASTYLDENTQELVFVQDGKFSVPVQYTVKDLPMLDTGIIEKLLLDFQDDMHKKQKLSILAKSIYSLTNALQPSDRFAFLLRHINELAQQFTDGYALFSADFSYDKVMSQLETAKIEEIGKIHKTFSDIQNQILGIPVATLVVATQMKTATTFGQEFWVNTAVLVGCFIYVLLTGFILRNQLHTLDAIGQEIARKKRQMLNEYSVVKDLIMQQFPLLEGRLKMQRYAFYIVTLVLLIGFALSVFVYIQLTDPAACLKSEIYEQLMFSYCYYTDSF